VQSQLLDAPLTQLVTLKVLRLQLLHTGRWWCQLEELRVLDQLEQGMVDGQIVDVTDNHGLRKEIRADRLGLAQYLNGVQLT